MSNVIVVGGGAAGMMAAIFAARNGQNVTLLEKNEKLGKKIFITGKGRCNITNASEIEDLFSAVISNPKFLYSGFYSFTNDQVIHFFEELGVATKIERGNRVFPVSDHSSDVIAALAREMQHLKVKVQLHCEVKELLINNEKEIKGVRLANGKKMTADAVVVATGGISYPSTGSTGDGYRFARNCGHKVTELFPSLVPMEVKEWYAKELHGHTIKKIEIHNTDANKKHYDEFGEMLFTHYGVTGPVILSASSIVGKTLEKKELVLHIDLKPALAEEQLDKRLLREFEANHNKQFKNAIDSLLPAKLRPVIIELSGIEEEKKVHEITKEERLNLLRLIKDFHMTLTGLRGYNEAIITKGGISVKEIDPGTMESKLIKNLYFAGEVLDLDAVTGGYNLQIAWSTGYLAGISAGQDKLFE